MKLKPCRFYCLISGILLSLLLCSSSYALKPIKLYESSVKVTPEKGENALIAEAFTQVLIKVSGRSDIPSSPAYKDMLDKARSAISQFRYDMKTLQSDDGSETTAETKPAEVLQEKWFWVRFNANTIDNLLKKAQLPVWGKVRPETLIWYSQEIRGQRRLQSQHDEPEVYEIFKRQADARGISLIFPFLDLQDRSSISTADIWGDFNDAIRLASRRYQAQSTATVRVFKERSGLWVSQWHLLLLGDVQSWELRDEQLQRILAAGIDELADKLARQFAHVVSESGDTGVLIQVNNVTGFKDFQVLDDYLRNLATVKSAALVQTTQDKVIYRISYLGDKNALIQEIRLGDMLNSVERSQVDYDESGNSNKDYQAVILDNLDNQSQPKNASAVQDEASARAKALAAMSAETTTQIQTPATGGQAANMAQEPAVPEKIVVPLIPELEYWLAL